ncbi:MAG: hypothetical protein IRZ16_21140 [Myxococcaceae bacterium]|nr:hypothetical protein [Myxococcaceae bacterium]
MNVRLLLFVAVALSVACASGARSQISALQQENRTLRAGIEAADQAAKNAGDYARTLNAQGGTLALALNGADLDALSQKVLPYRIPARSLNSMVTGNVVVERITGVRFYPGNKLTCQVFLRGENLRLTQSIPAAYKNQVARFLEGVTAGVVTDLEVTLTTQGQTVFARAVAKRSTLRKNRDASNEARLTQGMNESVLRKALDFDATVEGTPLELRGVATTPSHLVMLYGR